MYLVMSCSAFGAGDSWKVDMNSLGGLSDGESVVGDVEEVEDESPLGLLLCVGVGVVSDADQVSVVG